MLRDVSSRDLAANVLGTRVNFPVGISPSAFQRLTTDEGEMATAKGEVHILFFALYYYEMFSIDCI